MFNSWCLHNGPNLKRPGIECTIFHGLHNYDKSKDMANCGNFIEFSSTDLMQFFVSTTFPLFSAFMFVYTLNS